MDGETGINQIRSAITSPNDSPTPSDESVDTGSPRSTNYTTDSDPSITYPPPPVNNPTTRSLDEDVAPNASIDSGVAPLDVAIALILAANMSSMDLDQESEVSTLVHITPKNSVVDANEGEAAPIAGTSTTPTTASHFHEATTWLAFAKEDVGDALKRLAQAAKDLHKIERSVSVEQHYGELLAELLNAAEIKFDPKYLQ